MPFRRGETIFLALTPTSVIDYVFRGPIVLSWGNPSRSSYLSVVAELNFPKSDTIPTPWGRFLSTFSLLQIDMPATCTVPKHWVLDGFIVRPLSTRSFLPAQNWLRKFLQWLDLLSASYSQLTLLEVWELVGSCLIHWKPHDSFLVPKVRDELSGSGTLTTLPRVNLIRRQTGYLLECPSWKYCAGYVFEGSGIVFLVLAAVEDACWGATCSLGLTLL